MKESTAVTKHARIVAETFAKVQLNLNWRCIHILQRSDLQDSRTTWRSSKGIIIAFKNGKSLKALYRRINSCSCMFLCHDSRKLNSTHLKPKKNILRITYAVETIFPTSAKWNTFFAHFGHINTLNSMMVFNFHSILGRLSCPTISSTHLIVFSKG